MVTRLDNFAGKLVTDDVFSTRKKKGVCLVVNVRLKDTKNMPAASTGEMVSLESFQNQQKAAHI